MSRKILAGLSDFRKIMEANGLYVDKSDFISELMDSGSEVVAIARPRRFGKSLNMSMLSYFFNIENREENRKLFKGLKIEKSPYFAEQGQYPVINMTFKNVRESNWEECLEKIRSVVADEYTKHKYLMAKDYENGGLDKKDIEYFQTIIDEKSSIIKLKESLKKLSHYLNRYYGKRVVVLVDEYDTPIIEGELEGYFKEASNFMQGFLNDALKENESLHRGIITGITRLQGAGIFSGLNSADICTIFDAGYKDKFGFTEKEVKELLHEYKMADEEERVREHYNGYNFRGEVIYNPYSVVKSVVKREFGNFWLGSSSNDLAKKKVKQLIEMGRDEVIRKMVEDLLQGKKVKIKVKEVLEIREDMSHVEILNLLLYSGYLKYESHDEKRNEKGKIEVSIPNLEIKEIYNQSIEEWMEKGYGAEEAVELKSFLESVCKGVEGEIKKGLERYLERRSVMDGEKIMEMGYHNFIFGLLQGLDSRYLLESNRESGKGRYDIMLTPINMKEGDKLEEGVVIEMKVGEEGNLAEKSREALKQIEEKKYFKSLEGKGIKKARLIGIAFSGKEAEVCLKEISL